MPTTIRRSVLSAIAFSVCATGNSAMAGEWEMEVFNNPESKSWTLVGKSRAGEANSSKLCRISSGQQSPYEEQPWFKKYFGR